MILHQISSCSALETTLCPIFGDNCLGVYGTGRLIGEPEGRPQNRHFFSFSDIFHVLQLGLRSVKRRRVTGLVFWKKNVIAKRPCLMPFVINDPLMLVCESLIPHPPLGFFCVPLPNGWRTHVPGQN